VDLAVNKDSSSNAEGSKAPSTNATPEGSKASADELERTRKKLLREINRIDNWTNAAADNGLFDKQKKVPSDAFEDIQVKLKKAKEYFYGGDYTESDYYTSLALRSYDKALYLASRAWRFSNVYAGPMWLYLIGFLVAVLGFYWYQLDSNFLELHVRIQEASLHAATWGTVGGILRGIWYLKDKVSDRRYRNSFRIYFLSIPFLGGLFGAIVYFLLVSGLFILAPTQTPVILNQTASGANVSQTGSATQPNVTTAGNISTLAIIPLATLAGFNWEWAVMIFKRIGDTFKGEAESDDKIEK
jgi:hypothetical protein